MTEISNPAGDRRGRRSLVFALVALALGTAGVGVASIAASSSATTAPDIAPAVPTPPTPSPPTLLQNEEADLFVGPSARGSGDGADESNVAALADLDQVIASVGPGGIIELVESQGPYVITSPIHIRHGGAPGAPITIRGPVAGSRPQLVGSRTDPYVPEGDPGRPLFSLEPGADHLHFANLHCTRFGNGCFLVNAPIVDLAVSSITAANVQRFFETASTAQAMVTGLTIEQVVVSGFSKGAIRLGNDTNDVTIVDVVGDSEAQDGDNFAIGIHLVDTVHDVILKRVVMKNALDTLHPYWNGDGFAAEEAVYDITFIDTSASGNSDAGYDIKASDVEMIGVFASENKRNYRFSGTAISVSDCGGADPILRGGSGTQAQIQASGTAVVEVENCAFVDSSEATIVFDLDESARVTVIAGSLGLGERALVSTVEPGAVLDLGDIGENGS